MKRHTIHLLCQRSVLQGFNQSDQIVPDSQERRDSTRPRTGIFFNCCLAGPGGPFLYLWFCTSNSTFPATSSTQSEMLAFTIVLDRISKHAQGALINLHSRLTRINSLSLSRNHSCFPADKNQSDPHSSPRTSKSTVLLLSRYST